MDGDSGLEETKGKTTRRQCHQQQTQPRRRVCSAERGGTATADGQEDDAPCQQARQALLELESANCQVLASLAMSGIM